MDWGGGVFVIYVMLCFSMHFSESIQNFHQFPQGINLCCVLTLPQLACTNLILSFFNCKMNNLDLIPKTFKLQNLWTCASSQVEKKKRAGKCLNIKYWLSFQKRYFHTIAFCFLIIVTLLCKSISAHFGDEGDNYKSAAVGT